MTDVSNAVATVADARVTKFAVAILIGLGIGATASGDPLVLPVVGTTPSLLVGGVVALAGAGLWVGLDRYSDDCGCGGDCGC